MLPNIHDLKPVTLPLFREDRGVLVPIDLNKLIPFNVLRFFWVFDVPEGGTRGSHAHKDCQQYIVCALGSVHVEAFDGNEERLIILDAGQALYVPPTVFTTERFVVPRTVLMVFCDRPYEVGDYINDRTLLVEHRKRISGI